MSDARPDENARTALLQALRLDGEGRWSEAHALVAGADGPLAAWLHAYLHRKEGDLANARYWYVRARQKARTGPLEAERAELDAALAAREC